MAFAAFARPTSQNLSRFATVNGVKLHYLDWGGKGEALLFLTCLGGTADDFEPIAKPFTDKFHVLGLTRRGQGESDKPEGGYDTATLVEDIRAFLDSKRLKQVTLIGFSLAGNEMTEFATLYPKRVARLVYLDSAYDLVRHAELGRHLNLPPMPQSDKPTRELIARSNEYRPDYLRINAPALGVFVTYDEPPKSPMQDEATSMKLLQWWFDYGKAYRREQIDTFARYIKQHRVVELHNTTHGGFVYDKVQQQILIREMRSFFKTFP